MKRSRESEEDSSVAHGVEPHGATSDQTGVRAIKITELDESAIDDSEIIMRCSMPPHKEPVLFTSYREYEIHYSKAHMNRCVECRKNFPSEHLLGVHIEECHDAIAAVLRGKGEQTYSCFVEGCDRKCRTPQKRRMHLIDKHMYPKNYFFAVTKEGVDGRSSLLLEGGHHRRRSSASQPGGLKSASRRQSLRQPESPKANAKESKSTAGNDSQQAPDEVVVAEKSPDIEMAGLTNAMSALQFVPTSIRFGRGRGKVGFAKD